MDPTNEQGLPQAEGRTPEPLFASVSFSIIQSHDLPEHQAQEVSLDTNPLLNQCP